MVEAIKRGFPQREIADASFRYQQEVDAKKRIVVGVNEYRLADEEELELHCASTPRSSASRRAGCRRPAPGATRRAVERALGELKRGGRQRRRQPDAALPRRRSRPRLGGRDDRRPPGGVRQLHRAARFLMSDPQTGAESAPEDPRRRRQARAGRARPRRQDHRPRPTRRGHGGDLHRPAPDAGADRGDGDPGGRRRGRPLDPLRRPHDPGAAGGRAAPRAGRGRRADHGGRDDSRRGHRRS